MQGKVDGEGRRGGWKDELFKEFSSMHCLIRLSQGSNHHLLPPSVVSTKPRCAEAFFRSFFTFPRLYSLAFEYLP